jgi:hypothetical protein
MTPENLQLEDLSVDRRIILKHTVEKPGGRIWTGISWFRHGPVAGLVNMLMNLPVA